MNNEFQTPIISDNRINFPTDFSLICPITGPGTIEESCYLQFTSTLPSIYVGFGIYICSDGWSKGYDYLSDNLRQ